MNVERKQFLVPPNLKISTSRWSKILKLLKRTWSISSFVLHRIKCTVHYTHLHTLLLLSFVGYKFHNLSRIQTLKHLISKSPVLTEDFREICEILRKERRADPTRAGRQATLASFTSIIYFISPFSFKFAEICRECFNMFLPFHKKWLIHPNPFKHPTRLIGFGLSHHYSHAAGSPGSCHSTRAQYSLRGWDVNRIANIFIYFGGRMAMNL